MSVDLKPCPWCCGQTLEHMDYGDESYFWCHSCEATGPINDEEGTLWNTRAPDPAVAVLEAEVARLREFVSLWANYQVSIDAWGKNDETVRQDREELISLGLNMDYPLPAPSEKEAG